MLELGHSLRVCAGRFVAKLEGRRFRRGPADGDRPAPEAARSAAPWETY
jgi:hypothetical protein